MKLRLHNYWRSSASYRVRIALGLLELDYEYVVVNILQGAQHAEGYRAHNTMAQVPTLEVIEGEGGPVHHLTQSLPIIEYLHERFGTYPLLPASLEARAHARALAEIVNSGIQPLQNLSTTREVQALGGDDRAWVQRFIARGLGALEAAVSSSGRAGRFCLGDAPTIADCCLLPQVYSAHRFGVDPSAYPRINAIAAACEELPAFAAAHPDRQPDAPQRTT